MANLQEKYGSWALVTGASSGIGAEYARVLATRGFSLVLVARRERKLTQLASELQESHRIETRVVAADLTCAPGIDTVIQKTADLEIGLLVNNAGREDDGPFLDIPVEQALKTLRLNSEAPMRLTHHFGALMRERGRGGILFMSSIVAFQGVPLIANYAASKAYDLIFAESLAAELEPAGIDVLVLTPGFTESQLSPDANFEGLPLRPMSAASVARAGISGLGRTRLRIPGLINKFLYVTGKFLQPRTVNTWAFGKVFRRVLRSVIDHNGQPVGKAPNRRY